MTKEKSGDTLIPKQLQKKEFRFILLNGKIPFEKNWQNTNNYSYDDKKLLEHKNNYGVLCGKGDLLVIDFDNKEIQKKLIEKLPKGFSVRTGSGLIHKYFICKNGENIKVLSKEKDSIADVQFTSKQVVGVGSVHPETEKKYEVIDNLEIPEIDFAEIKALFSQWIKKEEPLRPKQQDTIVEQIKSKISMTEVLSKYGVNTTKNPTECLWHGSKGGKCFSFNDELFHCFHCDEGGDIFSFVMEQEKCDFVEAKKKLAKIVGIELKEDYKADSTNKVIDLKYSTVHLPFFDIFKKATQLYGDEYKVLLKGRWYQLVGMRLLNRKIMYKTIRQDTRVHLLGCLPSGKGKKNLKIVGKKIAEKLNYQVEEPTSLHPEQLVGKVIERGQGKKKEYIPNRGYFDSDLVQIDEALELIRSKDPKITESRGYICIATDPYGDNEVKKRLVEHLENETLKYCPKCSMMLFFQPIPIPTEAVTSGFMRRYLTLFTIPNTKAESIFEQRLNNTGSMEEYCDIFTEGFLRNVDTQGEWEFSEECKDTFSEYASYLVQLGYDHSKKGYQFTKIMEQTLLDLLVKFSCILTASYGQSKVTSNHIKMAFMDLVEMFYSTLDYVDKKVQGRLDYGSMWKVTNEKEQACLEWLYGQNATTYDTSNVTIGDFVNRIRKIFNYKDFTEYKGTQAHRKYLSFIKRKLVESKQVGKHSSKVWLGFEPKEEEIQEWKGCKGGTLYTEVFLLFSDKNAILQGVKPLQPLQPLKDMVTEGTVYQYIKDHPECSYNNVFDHLKVSEEEGNRLIDSLKSKGDISELKPDKLVVME